MSRLMKLTSRMILKKLFEQDGFLLEMAWYCFEKRRHDDVILEYLACHYNGLSVPMYQLLSAGLLGPYGSLRPSGKASGADAL